MPIYEYICDECGHAFEKLVPSSKSKPKCDKCGSGKLARQFSTFAAHGGTSAAGCSSMDQCPAAAASEGAACGSGCCPHAH